MLGQDQGLPDSMLFGSAKQLAPVMSLPTPAKICLGLGCTGLLLAVLNQTTAVTLDPALERSAVLSSFLAVGLMLVAVLWTRAVPEAAERVALEGEQGFRIQPGVPGGLAEELAWGSHMVLTATPAAVVLLVWRNHELLRRGLLMSNTVDPVFVPGAICERALEKQAAISLVDLRLYPGRDEFDLLLPGLPAVLVQPVGAHGLLLLGGWSARCFSRSDLAWVDGWAQKLRAELEALPPLEPSRLGQPA